MDLTYLEFRAKVAVNNYRNGVCRFCLISVPHMNSYTANELRNSKIPSIFKLLTDFEMNMTDEHPTSICDACVKEMEAAVHIREQFQNIEQYWRQYLNEISLDGGPLEMKTEPIDILSSPSITINDSGKSLITIAPDSKSNDLVTLRDPIQQSSNYLFNETMCSTNITEVTLSGCNIDQLEDENEEVETKPKYRHCCGICGVLFKRKTELNKHMKVHGKRVHEDSTDEDEDDEQKSSAKKSKKQMKANCNECGEKFTNKRSLVQHLHNHVNRYCDICKIDFPTIYEYEKHATKCRAVQEKARECKFCRKIFSTYDDLYNHHRIEGCKMMPRIFGSTPMKLTFTCTFCETEFTRVGLIDHLKEAHSSFTAYECFRCKENFPYLNTLKRLKNWQTKNNTKCRVCWKILEVHNDKLLHNARDISWINTLCHVCGVTIKHGNFRRHLSTMHSKGSTGKAMRIPESALEEIYCGECSKTFKYKSRFTLHVKFEHPESYNQHKMATNAKQLQAVPRCPICGKRFANTQQLREHRKVHRTHECHICKRKFTAKQNLESHIKQHSDQQRPFVCEICQASFVRAPHLKDHISRKHTKERPHKCTECNMGFTQMYELRAHIKIVHLKLKPFKCEFCDKAFSVMCDLKKHEPSHTGDFPHKCQMCLRAFRTTQSLEIHIGRNHNLLETIKTEN